MPQMIEVGTLRVEDGRGVGMRTYNADMLAKVSARMGQLGEAVAERAVLVWLGAEVSLHGKSALQGQVKALEKREAEARKVGDDREAAYCEVARFCVEAHLERGKA